MRVTVQGYGMRNDWLGDLGATLRISPVETSDRPPLDIDNLLRLAYVDSRMEPLFGSRWVIHRGRASPAVAEAD
eukprot:3508527-Alexandrium_andersonii.AAC.1